jgi:hypothetical protein
MVLTKPSMLTATVGEEIGQQLGAQMISAYRKQNPEDVMSYFVGRNILEQIMAQPGCVGIKFYNAYNEIGAKTLVYVGVSSDGTDMLTISSVGVNGQFHSEKGIVADRIKLPDPLATDWWDFE